MHPPSLLYILPFHGPTYAQAGGWGVGVGVESRGCTCVCMSECVRACTCVRRAEPIRAAPGTSPPPPSCLCLVCSISPPQWFLLQYKSQPALFSLTNTHARTRTHIEGDGHAHTRIRAQILLQLASAQSRLRGCTSQIVFQMCHLCMGLLPLLLALSPLPPVPQRDFSSAPASSSSFAAAAAASSSSSSSAPSSTSGNWPVCLCS